MSRPRRESDDRRPYRYALICIDVRSMPPVPFKPGQFAALCFDQRGYGGGSVLARMRYLSGHFHRAGLAGRSIGADCWSAGQCFSAVRRRFRFRDLSAASAMAVRSLGPPTTMSLRLAIGHSCGRAACRRKESPMSGSMVNFIAIIVRRSGAMS
jgi:hypothetical protein